MTTAAAPGIGHNRPPDLIDALRIDLEAEHAGVLTRRDEIKAALARLPQVEDEQSAGDVSDYLKVIKVELRNVDGARKAAKQPHLTAAQAVDAWFEKIMRALKDCETTALERLSIYQRAKEAEARRLADERARKLREEAEARAAEARRLEQQQRQARAEAAAREAAAKKAATEAERVKARTLANAAAHKAETLERRAEEKMATAVATEAAALKHEERAAAPAGELVRVRGDYGSVATVVETWKGEMTSRATIDLEALRDHLPLDGIERAIASFVRAGGRELRGARIFQAKSDRVN